MADSENQDKDGGIRGMLRLGVQSLNQILVTLQRSFPQQTGTSGTATGGAATLPGNPVGFIVVTLPDGTSAKVPYYT